MAAPEALACAAVTESPPPSAVPRRTGRTTAADGSALTYTVNEPDTEVKPALVCANGAGVSTFFWDHLAEHFGQEGHRVLLWDYRGHGASGAPVDLEGLDIEACARDLLRVMDAVGIEEAVLLGHSLGAQVILETWHIAPGRVRGLVPVLGSPGRVADTFLDPRVGRKVIDVATEITDRAPEMMRIGFRAGAKSPAVRRFARMLGVVHEDLAPDEDLGRYLEHLAHLDPKVFFRMVAAAQAHDATPYLEKIDVPTLVVAGERDLFTPRERSMEMVRAIPNAELLDIPRGSHIALVEQPELLHLRLEKFLAGPVARFGLS